MKKISTLIALATCVTIGGVYATWVYSTEDTTVDEQTEEFAIVLDNATTDASTGVFDIYTNIIEIAVSPYGAGSETHNSYEAVLSMKTPFLDENNPTGGREDAYILITFTPSAGADDDIKTYGITSYFYLGDLAPMQYAGVDVFEYQYTPDTAETADGVNNYATINLSNYSGEGMKWTYDSANNRFTYRIEGEALSNLISFSQAFVLDSKEEYDNFDAALNSEIILTITDVAPEYEETT